MNKKQENVFGYIDDLNDNELADLKNQLASDIEFLKEINDKKNRDFEIERLRYASKLLNERKQKTKKI